MEKLNGEIAAADKRISEVETALATTKRSAFEKLKKLQGKLLYILLHVKSQILHTL